MLPAGSVARADTLWPGTSGEGSWKSIVASPVPFVVAWTVPTSSSPSLYAVGRVAQRRLAYTSTSYVVEAALLRTKCATVGGP